MDLYGIAFEAATLNIPEAALNASNPSDPIDCIILQEGWGQSGYYGRDVMEAGFDKFPAGTMSFLGHPALNVEEPPLTAGIMTEGARFVASDPEADGRPTLRAPLSFFSDVAPKIRERAKHKAAALSIRIPVTFKMGTVEGRTGKVVTSFPTPALSVDVVARAGAGGAFGVIQESAVPQSIIEKQEGSEMPLSKEEIADMAGVVAESLRPTLEGITTALGNLAVAHESNAPKALSARELSDKITTAKLAKLSSDRVYLAVESLPAGTVADGPTVDRIIATESEIFAEALAAAKAELGEGNVQLDQDGNPIEQAQESAGVTAWKVAKA